jgi:hypothetical protein
MIEIPRFVTDLPPYVDEWSRGPETDPYEAACVDDVCHLAPSPTWAWHVC